jgi:hypothetical protein
MENGSSDDFLPPVTPSPDGARTTHQAVIFLDSFRSGHRGTRGTLAAFWAGFIHRVTVRIGGIPHTLVCPARRGCVGMTGNLLK